MSALEDALVFQIRACRLPEPGREVALIPGRKFRADLCWPLHRLVCEVDGGCFVAGRHSRGMGVTSDCEKHNLLTLAGWRVLRVTNVHVRDGSALKWIEQALAHDGQEAIEGLKCRDKRRRGLVSIVAVGGCPQNAAASFATNRHAPTIPPVERAGFVNTTDGKHGSPILVTAGLVTAPSTRGPKA